MAIPKKIHYCWFGQKAKGNLIEDCISSWKAMLPGFEIVEWNESNYSSESFFFNSCIAKKKFAFASDYARFDVLEKYGGIYLDTDMLVIKPFDELLQHHCFFGYENEQHFISCGIIGAVTQDKFIQAIRKDLDLVTTDDFFTDYTIVKMVTRVYEEIKDTHKEWLPEIYPVDYFYPYPYEASGDPLSYKTENTMAIHLWNASWMNDFYRAQLLFQQGKKTTARKLFVRSLLSKPQNIRFIKRFFP